MPDATTSFSLAERFDQVGFSDIVQIRNKVMELRGQGMSVFQFEGGEPFMHTPEPVKQAMVSALAENKTRYAPSSGITELRQAVLEKVRRRNKLKAQIEDVIIVNGGMQGLFAAFECVLDPGDEVLMFSPFWTPIKDLVGFCQAKTVLVSMEQARAEGIERTLSRYVTPRTKMVYYNTPQNPSGVVLTRQEAEAVARFVREHDLVVVADEAYEDLLYDGEHVSIASLEGMFERALTCFTLSKSYAMTGWRVGYVVAPEPWMTGLKKATLYSTNGVSTPSQWAALAAILLPDSYFLGVVEEYRKRRDLLVNGLNTLGFRCAMPLGAFYAFPDAGNIDRDSRRAAAILLERAQVATVPGVVFGEHGEGHLRFSFSTSPEAIEAGLVAMKAL